MLKWALVGASVVPLIFGVNYLVLQNYYETAIGEAQSAVGAVAPGTFSSVAFPARGDLANPPPLAFKICGYIDGRRFIYDARTRQFEVDNEPGQVCDQRYYPSTK